MGCRMACPPNDPRDGGAEGVRTPDPQNAILVLYQLSYDPIHCYGNVPGDSLHAQGKKFVKKRAGRNEKGIVL
jgi:hypothetical protein